MHDMKVLDIQIGFLAFGVFDLIIKLVKIFENL